MIRFDDVEVRFGDQVAIPGLDLEIHEGEFFTLLGPSGCGKTTALRTLAGFVDPSRGDIVIDGQVATRLPSEKRRVGMVFQNYALFPSMSVRQNIAFGLTVRKAGKAEPDRLVRAMADQVELSEAQLDKNVAELSGGQQQRVAIARALVLEPRILLLDEPLSNLDAKLRVQLRDQLKGLQSRLGITTVYVTHDQEEALTMSDRIAVFDAGRIEQVGTPEDIYDRSATEFVATFVGAINALGPSTVGRLRDAGAADLDASGRAYVRLERVSVDPRGAAPADARRVRIDGVVAERSYHGSYSTYRVDLGDDAVQALVAETGAPPLAPGTEVVVGIDPAAILQYRS
ncbi:ABC transporter ATP-binding protein [Clavibacter michiganensis]|uniref:ABC transporter ATP-binding protein n=1 Tax=Clavibacter michiganensis TaxID=28447 RepID=UPI00292D776E|nr:ABC transporter ATP-binding protein [Clavibacter michiganensis]